MNVKVVIELDGPAKEVEAWLARLGVAAQSGTFTLPDVTSAGRGDAHAAPISVDGQQPWTPALADRLIYRITDLARRALSYMAHNAPEVSFSEIQKEMGMDGVQMGGVLASFGFAKNAGIPRPYTVDRRSRRYLMEPDVAALCLDAIRRYEEE